MSNNIILGAGIAGLGAGYRLRQNQQLAIILEKDDTYGGLCGNFTINGFRFDRFVHFSFAKDEDVNRLFMEGVAGEVYRHTPNAYNLYQGLWLKHPAQNNLFSLSQEMKEAVVRDFKARPTGVDSSSIANYEQWLRFQFGDYFAEHFPIPYTRKYWMKEAKDLETKWMGSREGSRLYQPSVEEVVQGCNTSETPVTYYSREMRYPQKGGFKQFLSVLAEKQDIRYNQRVVSIDVEKRLLHTSGGDAYQFDRLISSLPLPEIITMLQGVPAAVCNAAARLHCTCGYQISVGLKTKNIPPYLWWYIYDEDILPARVYSPSLKSPDNAPEGCSSLQMEVYCNRNEYTQEELLARSVGKLVEQNIIYREDILFVDVRFEPYANVIFDHNIYKAREIVRDYLSSIGIETIGRFGEWGYLWSDQSLLSGLNVPEF
ncbi:protoporphyrinogen/coproporphyrinogen oxidase [Phocaeicola sp.]